MLELLKKRRDEQEGFTLIELMVVVLIIGILLAIAVPTFLNAQENAKSKAATSNLRQGLSAAKTVYADEQAYATVDASDLNNAEPSLEWVTTASTAPNVVSFDSTTTANAIHLAVRSKHNICYHITDNVAPGGGTTYGKVDPAPAAGCTASATAATASTPDAADW